MTVYANRSNLAATDHLGRALPEYGETREKQDGKTVALFYYLWHGYHSTEGPYDLSKIFSLDPDALAHVDSAVWPDVHNAPLLHWGEPLFGYYISQDEWVLRRHVQLFIDAGVDVLFFDTTNGFTYKKAYLKLFAILKELRDAGFAAPQVCFYLAPQTRGCGTGNMMQLWEELYEPGLYSDLWFRWKGKPLIVCHSHRAIPKELRDFFTWRTPTWCAPERPDTWAWEGNPQKVSVDADGNPEEIAVSVVRNASDPSYGGPETDRSSMSAAYWGVPIYGRSWHDGYRDTRENASHYGFQFREQAECALRLDPPVAFLCQWNEWLVPFLTKYTYDAPDYGRRHDIVLRDEYNEEYSRDLEPMKGGYRDAYYLQMAEFCRRFKGLEPPAKAYGERTVDIRGDFAQWKDISPVYREYTGDTAPRSSRAYDEAGQNGRYESDTGRNEFSELRIAADREQVYFYAACTGDITPPAPDRTTLWISIPGASLSAWEGYSFVIGRKAGNADSAVIERCSEDGIYRFEELGTVPCAVSGRELMLSVPRSVLGLPDGCFRLDFKWSDNISSGDIMDFYIDGDAAPRGRMRYIFYWEP